MTFQEQYDDAAAHGVTPAQMRRNCEAQRDGYRRLAKRADIYGTNNYLCWATGETWHEAAARCDAMLAWFDAQETGG